MSKENVEQVSEDVTVDETQNDEVLVEDNSISNISVPADGEYRGSKDLNPEQRPISIINPEKYTQQEIDNMILADPTMVQTDEEIKENTKQAEENKKEDERKGEEDSKDSTKDTKEGEIDEEGPEVKEFLEFTKLTKEEFTSLNEEVQEKIFDLYENKTSSGEVEQIKKEYFNHKSSTDKLLQDPLISTRIKEIQTGQMYLPKTIPSLTNEEYQTIENAEGVEDRNKAINEIVQKRVDPYLKNAWNTIEQEKTAEKHKMKTFEILSEVGDLDPDFKFEGVNFDEMKFGHPRYNEFYNSNIGQLAQYLINAGENYASISKKTPETILAMYNAATGRDKKRDEKIASNVKKEILKRFRNPTKATDGKPKARTAKQSGMSGHSRIGAGDMSNETLIQEMLGGNMDSFNVLGAQAEGHPEKTARLKGVMDEFLRRQKLE